MNSKIIDKFKDNKVVIIGDVMLDKYLSGKIERISPEAPVPIVSLQEREARLGGAANVALSIKALEAEALLFSIIGDDENGRTLTKLVSERQISTKHLVISPYRMTTVKSRILASNQQILRVDEEDTHPLHQDVESKLYADLAAFIANNEVAVIMLLDIQPTDDSLKEVHKALHNQLKNEISLVTLSEHGMYFGTKEVSHLVPTKPRKIVDVCGAGDAVVAIVALCIAHQVNPLIICKLANMAGGQVCESVGVVPVEKVNLCRELSNDTLK